VLIATRNGAQTLPDVLGAYRHVKPPIGGWKLVIVDNGSTDDTRKIIQSFSDQLPLTHDFEPILGKNASLNAALASVEGDLVVLSDDDILPHCDWLVELRGVADSQPTFSVFGGTVTLRWDTPPDDWILSWVNLSTAFGMTDPSWEDGPIHPGNIFGGNMAIRKRVFEAGYRFDARIGPRGTNYAMGSETELTRRLDKAEFRTWHCRKAIVEHIVRKSQMTREWILRRAFRFGRGLYRLEVQHEYANREKFFGIPRHLIKETVMEGLGAVRAKLNGNKTKFFRKCWEFYCLMGYLNEARLIHIEARHDTAVLGVAADPQIQSAPINNEWNQSKPIRSWATDRVKRSDSGLE
jgi:L-malate glycosyltransferase